VRARAHALLLLGPLLLVTSPAAAHEVIGGDSGLLNGALHPFVSVLIAPQLLATALFLHQTGSARGAGLVILALGVLLGAAIFPLVPAENAVLWLAPVAGLIAGGLTALALPLPRALVLAAAAAFGLALGYCNGEGLASQEQPLLYLIGLTVATTTVAYYVGVALARLDAPWLPIAVRAVASWVVALDLMLMGLLVAQPTLLAAT
jgi:hydrogenase/urease accessory protein HupE